MWVGRSWQVIDYLDNNPFLKNGDAKTKNKSWFPLLVIHSERTFYTKISPETNLSEVKFKTTPQTN